MLYQTHHPLLFQFHHHLFTSSSIPLPSANPKSLLSFHSSSSSPPIKEMECVEAALKTSFRKEMGTKPNNPQAFMEDMLAVSVNGVQNGGVSCDDFFVDDLLDFSNDDVFVEENVQDPQEEQQQKQQEEEEEDEEDRKSNPSTIFSTKEDFESIPTTELGVPADDLADLEWLSHFVEDSNSEYSAAYPAGTLQQQAKSFAVNRPKTGVEKPVFSTEPCFKTPVPAKARSKRTRIGGSRVWSLGSPSFTESSSSSTTSSSSSSSPSSPWVAYTTPSSISSIESVEPGSWEKPPVKRQKKVAEGAATSGGGGSGSLAQPPRRCSHCGVQKTPQWRTGPLGAKTLCNACGVRYKSGRLLPEYRPACSPTFSSELHSNHHRKVLEMRRKKEVLGQTETGLSAPPQAVPSF